ncbi:MAG: hypothetical protein DRJ69_04815 [Thermoprotei archaeon]|nr:MAG: hypothetical protein DRJ69_04815 [Thermoprotei archaeon]
MEDGLWIKFFVSLTSCAPIAIFEVWRMVNDEAVKIAKIKKIFIGFSEAFLTFLFPPRADLKF